MKRSVAAILIIIIGLSSYLWADNLRRTHGVMFHDGETLIRREQVYQQAPQARIEPYALYYGSSGSLSLLSHLDYIPAEYDQGQCGDCWMWAGTSVMAIALDVNNNIHDRLSVQYLNSNAGVVGLSCCSGGDLP
ncbi:MAG TPA: hypothetical protein VMU10_08890, partial [Desulfomonilia bacterium]|nr:hypothetical protein [Desulfomonilia bacterium]